MVQSDKGQIAIDSHFNNLILYKKINSTKMERVLSGDPFQDMYGTFHYNIPEYSLTFPEGWSRTRKGLRYREKDQIPTYAYMYDIGADLDAGMDVPLVAFDLTPEGGHGITGFYIELPFNRGRKVMIVTAEDKPFDVYLFVKKLPRPQIDDRFGLEVYNEKGEVIFDSQNKYLRLLQKYDPNKKVAAILSSTTAWEMHLSSVNFDWLRGLAVRNGEVIPMRYFIWVYGGGGTRQYPEPIFDTTPILVDVTGF